jgi:hypothetical protein
LAAAGGGLEGRQRLSGGRWGAQADAPASSAQSIATAGRIELCSRPTRHVILVLPPEEEAALAEESADADYDDFAVGSPRRPSILPTAVGLVEC